MTDTKTILIMNNKGGVGKTTANANVAYALANSLGKKVLVIDYDSQASLTHLLNYGLKTERDYYSIYEIMEKELEYFELPEELENCTMTEALKKTIVQPSWKMRTTVKMNGKKEIVDVEIPFGFDLLPSHLKFSDYEYDLFTSTLSNHDVPNIAFHLTNVINTIKNDFDYDYILIDCMPSLNMVAINCITAAVDGVIVITNFDTLSTDGFGNMIGRVTEVQELLLMRGIQHQGMLGVIMNQYDERRRIDKQVKNLIERMKPIKILGSPIPDSTKAKEAAASGRMFGQLYKKAENVYIEIAKDIISEIERREQSNEISCIRIDTEEKSEIVVAKMNRIQEMGIPYKMVDFEIIEDLKNIGPKDSQQVIKLTYDEYDKLRKAELAERLTGKTDKESELNDGE